MALKILQRKQIKRSIEQFKVGDSALVNGGLDRVYSLRCAQAHCKWQELLSDVGKLNRKKLWKLRTWANAGGTFTITAVALK